MDILAKWIKKELSGFCRRILTRYLPWDQISYILSSQTGQKRAKILRDWLWMWSDFGLGRTSSKRIPDNCCRHK